MWWITFLWWVYKETADAYTIYRIPSKLNPRAAVRSRRLTRGSTSVCNIKVNEVNFHSPVNMSSWCSWRLSETAGSARLTAGWVMKGSLTKYFSEFALDFTLNDVSSLFWNWYLKKKWEAPPFEPRTPRNSTTWPTIPHHAGDAVRPAFAYPCRPCISLCDTL